MRTRALIAQAALFTAVWFLAGTLAGCGGRQIPTHDGYRERWVKGWKKPNVIELDEDYEAEVDGELSYPKRLRARWFAVDLPEDGALVVQLAAAPLGLSPEEADLVDVDDPFDVGFEVYNEKFKVLTRADREESDVGERKKTRTVDGLPKGRYLIHLFVQRRLDEAEYTLQLRFKRGSADPETDFPKNVAFVDPLPVVPAFDDAPAPPPPKCRGRRCRSKVSKKTDDKKETPAETPKKDPLGDSGGTMKAKIIVVRGQSGGGTAITLNRGSSHGVQTGWKGHVITKAGTKISSGEFTITSVKANSSNAKVILSPDAVKDAGRAVLQPN